MYPGFELHFEMTMRSFLGEEADHIASQAFNATSRKKWYAKCLRKVLALVDQLETSTKHKESIVTWTESALSAVTKEFDEQTLLLYLFRLSGALLGFTGTRGAVLYTPVYSQNHSQHYTEVIISGGDVMQDYYDSKNIIAVQRALVLQLKEEGYSDFKIGQVLSISEYQVKKLRKDI